MIIDTRGFSCPTPVLMVRNEIVKNGSSEFSVLADNNTSKENILRFASNHGYSADVKMDGRDYQILLTKI